MLNLLNNCIYIDGIIRCYGLQHINSLNIGDHILIYETSFFLIY
jgi:hypothetical protein